MQQNLNLNNTKSKIYNIIIIQFLEMNVLYIVYIYTYMTNYVQFHDYFLIFHCHRAYLLKHMCLVSIFQLNNDYY
jgi:hypothetical protein